MTFSNRVQKYKILPFSRIRHQSRRGRASVIKSRADILPFSPYFGRFDLGWCNYTFGGLFAPLRSNLIGSCAVKNSRANILSILAVFHQISKAESASSQSLSSRKTLTSIFAASVCFAAVLSSMKPISSAHQEFHSTSTQSYS